MITHKRAVAAVAVLMAVAAAVPAVDFNAECYRPGTHEFFTSGFQRFVTARRGGGETGRTKASSTAGLVGYRYATPQWSAGAALSYEGGTAKNTFDGGDRLRVRDDTVGVSLFGTYTGMTGWYVAPSFFTGFNRQKVRGGTVDGGPVGSGGRDASTYYAATLELGKMFDLGLARVTPHAGFNYASVPGMELGFSGAGAAESWNRPSQNFYEVPVGVSLERDFYAGDWMLTPSVDLTVIGSLGKTKSGSYNSRAGFAAYDGRGWQVHGVGSGRWGGRVAAGLNAVKADTFDLGVTYTYEARKDYNDHRIMAGVGFKF